jgi:NAD(P)H-hydrate repair Nnr-like enzyme with NAD(P)H-hydrate dehydratase domain
VPGDLATPTGGYGYDRRMIAELQRLGWRIDVVLLGDGFPRPSAAQKAFADKALAAVEGNHPVVIDGLALGVLPEAAASVRAKRPLVALIHHPLALETGLSATDADAMRISERAALASASTVIVTSAPTAMTSYPEGLIRRSTAASRRSAPGELPDRRPHAAPVSSRPCIPPGGVRSTLTSDYRTRPSRLR